jgi:hypothetical protein
MKTTPSKREEIKTKRSKKSKPLAENGETTKKTRKPRKTEEDDEIDEEVRLFKEALKLKKIEEAKKQSKATKNSKKRVESDEEMQEVKKPKKEKKEKAPLYEDSESDQDMEDDDEDLEEDDEDSSKEELSKEELKELSKKRLEKTKELTKKRLEKILIEHDIENPSLLNNAEIIKPVYVERILRHLLDNKRGTKIKKSDKTGKDVKELKFSRDGILMIYAAFNGELINLLNVSDSVRRGEIKKKYISKTDENGKVIKDENGKSIKMNEFELVGNILKKSHIESAMNIINRGAGTSERAPKLESKIVDEY